MRKLILILVVIFLTASKDVNACDGYELWLKYEKVCDEQLLEKYRLSVKELMVTGVSKGVARHLL